MRQLQSVLACGSALAASVLTVNGYALPGILLLLAATAIAVSIPFPKEINHV